MSFPKYVHKCAEIFGGRDAAAMRHQISRTAKILNIVLDRTQRLKLKAKRRENYRLKYGVAPPKAKHSRRRKIIESKERPKRVAA